MAASSVLPGKLELPSTIQELTKSNTNQIPERYVVINPNLDPSLESNGCVLPWMDSSIIIDLQLLFDFSSPCAENELLKLRDALSSWGCFQLVNHGVASSLMDQLHSVGKEFFALPLEEKQKYSRTAEWFEGYGCDVVSKDQPINWNDRLHLRIHPPQQRNLKLWPEIVPNFREALDEYSIEMRKVLEIMLRAIAKSLNLEENTFLSQLGEDSTFFARFNFYPPCPHPDRVLGLKPHSDSTLITILLQDKDVEGLQVLKDDQWYKVPVIPNALVVNVGDQLEIMSNGILTSPVHRAVIDKEKERMSVAVPCSVAADKEIGPLSELIDKDRPQLYKNVANYMYTSFQHYARGERGINAVKIKQ
ncbi:protein LATERAL BRANCHING OXIDOREDUCTASE 1-like [Silene latifolia]|uniref:protein LATERAL BRANCHING OXIDOREDUCTASE 1-like n=1 Tax=Silene latifolia TaxID=37657 RepID=UPI003D7779FD